jgi:hypothetical protein
MARAHLTLGNLGVDHRPPSEPGSGHLFEFTERALRTILTRFYGFRIAQIDGDQSAAGTSVAGFALVRLRRRIPALSQALRVVAIRRP